VSFFNHPADVQPSKLALSSGQAAKWPAARAYNTQPSWLTTDALVWIVMAMAAGILSLLFSDVAVGML
jgi:hypothetical protein